MKIWTTIYEVEAFILQRVPLEIYIGNIQHMLNDTFVQISYRNLNTNTPAHWVSNPLTV